MKTIPVHLDFRCLRCGSLTERIREGHSEGFVEEQLTNARKEIVYHACHDGGVGLTKLLGMHWPEGEGVYLDSPPAAISKEASEDGDRGRP